MRTIGCTKHLHHRTLLWHADKQKKDPTMKRAPFLMLFVGTHLIFVFLIIYKHQLRIQLLYEKQKQEALYAQLVEKKDHLTQQLCALKDKKAVKTYAHMALNMKPIALNQIKKIVVHG
jgi:cell division protein FtsB